MDLITKDSETRRYCFHLDRVLENVEHIVTNYRPVLNGEHYLTGEEVCQRLCISKRTLQDYRDTGLLGYVATFREKSFIVKVTSGIYWIGITGNEILKTCYLGILIA